MKYFFYIAFLFFVFNTIALAQAPPMAPAVYVQKYSELAIEQMVEFKIPASVTLAQAIFESGCGNSNLAKRSNNHFGIKCHIEWGGDTIVKTDDTLNECFRSYKNVEDSYLDRSLFLKSRARYAGLFNLKANDYKSWCYGLKNAGYATYGCYIDELIKIIETNKLNEFDEVENLSAKIIYPRTEELIKTVPVDISKTKFTAEGLDLFFTNEKDILIQSFNWLVDKYNEEEPIIISKN